jgi:DNA polymerase-3 subunit delta'
MLMRSVEAGRIPHALLFSGPRGTGKRTAARRVAQAILCRKGGAPCMDCPQCKQFLSGNHPDVHTVTAPGRSIGVDQIRELRETLALKPFSGARHIVIIEQADKMTTAAQNAILKTLEEPAGESVFFLITDSPGALLSTIVSRARRLRFAPLPIAECAHALTGWGIEPARAAVLAGYAQGSVGRALEINENAGYDALRARVLASLRALTGVSSVARAASMLSDAKDSAEDALEIMEVASRDRMAAQSGAQPYTAIDALPIDGRRLLQGVMELRRMLASNVSWQSALERTYLAIAHRDARTGDSMEETIWQPS